MNLETASKLIQACRERMEVLYHKPVFDEWVVLNFDKGKAQILHYRGPRSDDFAKVLHRDTAPLMAEMQGKPYSVGDFEFVDQAYNSHYDACIRLGETAYLLCNNTFGTMADLRHDPRWREAQKPFVDLTEKFRVDPLA